MISDCSFTVFLLFFHFVDCNFNFDSNIVTDGAFKVEGGVKGNAHPSPPNMIMQERKTLKNTLE